MDLHHNTHGAPTKLESSVRTWMQMSPKASMDVALNIFHPRARVTLHSEFRREGIIASKHASHHSSNIIEYCPQVTFFRF
jgi:hypothetical protein